MSAVSINIPNLAINKYAEVEVKVNGKKKRYSYRIEMFDWNVGEDLGQRIMKLRAAIKSYESEWELIQIYNPEENLIPVLFRQRGYQRS